MNDIILHHYPESPFSEKIRLLAGYKGLSYKAVTIPVIMPKPDLMPLTGGYRKTPVLQIGADIYCDTALICRVIDRLAPTNSIYPPASRAMASAAAQWTDGFFFRVCVTVAFQPRALAQNKRFQDPATVNAFIADRAKLTEGGSPLAMDLACAQPYFLGHLTKLDRQLEAAGPFLFGETPTIADFSTYHCCWFVHNNAVLQPLFEPFTHLRQWLQRMAAFGHGDLQPIAGSDALDIARQAQPVSERKAATTAIDDLAVGDMVEVMPIDYGLQPVRGTLLLSSLEELVIARHDERVGDVAVHFPRMGFQVAPLPNGESNGEPNGESDGE